MNTKQKLTLGIAAIFMVTLTIVGVTYAYFVTRVTTNDEAKAAVTAAQIGAIEYKEVGEPLLSLANMIPGDNVEDVVYKPFSVINKGETEGFFDITLTSTLPSDAISFIHSGATYTSDANNSEAAATIKDKCYVANAVNSKSTDPVPTAECFVADADYDNIVYTIYEVTGDLPSEVTKDNFGTLNTSQLYTGKISSKTGAQTVNSDKRMKIAGTTKDNITAENYTTNKYVLKVEYVNRNANQNIENNAALDIQVSIK